MDIKEILKDKYKTDEFLLKNKGLIYIVFKKIYPSVLNTHQEEDWIQEGLLWLYQAMLKYDESKGVKFSVFATTHIKNKLLNKLRCNKNRIKFDNNTSSLNIEVENNNNQIIDLVSDKINIEEYLINKSMLENLINILTDKQKIVLKYITENKSQADIARELGCSRENVRQIINNIKKQISKIA